MFRILVSGLFLCLTFPLNSQTWIPIDGPYGGIVQDIFQAKNGDIFVATRGNGIIKSSDNGLSWQERNDGISDKIIKVIKQGPNGNLYCIGDENSYRYLYKSSDNGNNWIKMTSTFATWSDVAIGNDNSVFVSMTGYGGRLYRTTDEGQSWNIILTNNGGLFTIHVAKDGTILALGYGYEMFRSTDNGSTFSSSHPFQTSESSELSPLAINSLGYIFIGISGQGIFRSTNSGLNWQKINTGLSSLNILDIFVDSNNKIFIIAGNEYISKCDIYYSENNGLNWNRLLSFDTTPDLYKESGLNRILVSNLYDIYLGGNDYSAGFYKSSDNGKSWDLMHLTQRKISAIGIKKETLYAAGYIGDPYMNNIPAIFYRKEGKWKLYKNINSLQFEIKLIYNSPLGLFYAGGTNWAGIPSGGAFGIDNSLGWGSYGYGSDGDIVQSLTSYKSALYAGTQSMGVIKITSDESTGINNNLTNNDILSLVANTDYIFAGTNGGGVYRTSSESWSQVNNGLNNNYWVNALTTDSKDNIYAGMGFNGGIYKSTDNGDSWAFSGLQDITVTCFGKTPGEIFVGTENNGMYKSTNQGITWNVMNEGLTSFKINSIGVQNDGHIYIAADKGIYVNSQLFTADTTSADTINTNSWFWENPLPTNNDFSSIDFIDENTAYLVGENGTIFKLSDGGNIWLAQESNTNSFLNSVHFVNGQIGYIAGHAYDGTNNNTGAVLKTTDGGLKWSIMLTGQYYLNDIYFVNVNYGLAVGLYGKIIKTTDGGISWGTLSGGTSDDLYSVFFTDENNGCVVGDYGRILITKDGGNNWTNLSYGYSSYDRLLSVYFIDMQTGFACGGDGRILKTTSGGNLWFEQSSGSNEWLSSLYFLNSDLGYCAGTNGTVIKTTNGGNTWNRLLTGTNAHLNSIYFTNESTGYLVGIDGTILKTTNGGGITAVEEMGIREVPESFQLMQNYPNPFNPTTTISYSIPKTSFVSLKVYDVLGREITVLVNEEKDPGSYSAIFNSSYLASGVYIFELRGDQFATSKKMVVLK